MNPTHTISGFQLEPGEVLGGRFRVEGWDPSDPVWPALAADLLDHRRPVQLAVRPVGPWMIKTPTTRRWGEPWPVPHPACLLPRLDCPDLRHGGGILDVRATPHIPPLIGPPEEHTADSPEPHGPEPYDSVVYDLDPATRKRLRLLRALHRVSATIETLHQSGGTHGSLGWSEFRSGDEGCVYLRPAPGHAHGPNRRSTSTRHLQAADRQALQQMACELMPRESIGPTCSTPPFVGSDTAAPIHTALRTVLRRRFRQPNTAEDTAAWRRAFDRLIRHLEAASLTTHARHTRHGIIDAMFRGDMEQAIRDAAASPDPWCREIDAILTRHRGTAQDGYRQWLDECRDLPLHTACERLLELMQRGFALPSPQSTDQLLRRLTGSIQHLSAAATAIRNRSWQHAHDALSAATALDPANPTLATLITLTPRKQDL